MAIGILKAGTKGDPTNSNGKDIADTVNYSHIKTVYSRIARVAAKAFNNNPHSLPVMSTPPTVTANGTSAPAGQTNGVTISSFPNFYRQSGGTRVTAGRLKSASIATTGGNIGSNNGDQASYGRYRFIADANKVTFRVSGTTAAYRFIVNGQYVSLAGTTTASPTQSPDQYITLDFTSAGGRAEREIILEVQTNCSFTGAYVGTTEKIFEAPESILRTVCLGDSYCYGSSATALGDGVDAVMADYLGWTNHINSGSGGTGWATTNSAYTFLQRIQNGDIALCGGTPDVVCLQGSINDKNAAASTVTANCLAGLQAVRNLYPMAVIFVFGVWGASGGTGGTLSIAANEQAISDAVTAFADANTFFIPINGAYGGAWLTGTGTTSSPTGTGNADVWMFDASHLGDYGTAAAGKIKAAAVMRIANQKA